MKFSKSIYQIFPVLAILTLFNSGCGSGSLGPPSPTGTFRTLRFTAQSDKLVYARGDTASFVITANNVGAAPVTIASGTPFFSLQYHLATWVTVYSGSKVVRQYFGGPSFGDSVTIGAGSSQQKRCGAFGKSDRCRAAWCGDLGNPAMRRWRINCAIAAVCTAQTEREHYTLDQYGEVSFV